MPIGSEAVQMPQEGSRARVLLAAACSDVHVLASLPCADAEAVLRYTLNSNAAMTACRMCCQAGMRDNASPVSCPLDK